MQPLDARILGRAAAPTSLVGAVMVIIGAVIGGGKGLLGALFGVAVVTAFFAVSVFAVSRVARVSPSAIMGTAVGTYIAKILVLLALVAVFKDTTAFNTRIFGITALVCILVWSGAQVVTFFRLRIPYVEPDGRQ